MQTKSTKPTSNRDDGALRGIYHPCEFQVGRIKSLRYCLGKFTGLLMQVGAIFLSLTLAANSNAQTDRTKSNTSLPGSATKNQQARPSLFVHPPLVRDNPNRRAPLICIVDVQTSQPTKVQLEISDGQRTWKQWEAGFSTNHSLAVMGMYPDRQHQIKIQVASEDGSQQDTNSVQYATGKLPEDFPPLDIDTSMPAKMESGIRMFAVNQWLNDTSIVDYGYLIAVDQTGKVVWYCKTDDRIADFRVLRNGNILYQHGSYRFLYEIDIFGRDLRSWYAARSVYPKDESSIPVDCDTLHHETIELANGNFLTLSTELRRFEKYPMDEFNPQTTFGSAWVVCDEIIEFEPNTGKIVKRLPITDLLDHDRFGYLCNHNFWKDKYDEFIDSPSRDWSHANALQYSEKDDSVLVSLRHLDCVIKLDWINHEIQWILGDPSGWSPALKKLHLDPEEGLRWSYHQHAPHFTDNGLLLMFDNGNYRAVFPQPPLPAAENASRVVAYRIDQESNSARQVYSYGLQQGDRFYSPFYGEAELLPMTRNLLITDGGRVESDAGQPLDNVPGERQWGRILEITSGRLSEKVFQLVCASPPGSETGWSIYRCNLYPNLRSPFAVNVPSPNEPAKLLPRELIRKRNPLQFYTPKIMSSENPRRLSTEMPADR